MSDETIWPPPMEPGERWAMVTPSHPESQGGGQEMRQAQLWGQTRWITRTGDVLCSCGLVVAIGELCRVGNGHLVSPVAHIPGVAVTEPVCR